MRHLLLLAVFLYVSFAQAQTAQPAESAQTTWHGLHFGSTLAEVRQSLAKDGFELQPPTDCSHDCQVQWVLVSDWKFQAPASETPLYFKVRLFFTHDDHLEVIHLLLAGHERSAASDAYTAVTSVKEQMTGKYGAPATKSGSCDNVQSGAFTDAAELECSMVWQADGQNVKLSWLYFGSTMGGALSKLTLEINYTQLRSGF